MATKFSHTRGIIIEVRPRTDVNISTPYGSVHTQTTHINQCRIKWDDGREEFADCLGVYSVGDKIAILFEGRTATEEINLNTGAIKDIRPTGPSLWRGALGINPALTFLFLIGVLFYYGLQYVSENYLFGVALMGGSVALLVLGLIGGSRKGAARDEYRRSIPR